MGTHLRELPLREVGVARVERVRDRELEHAVAEELEPLVRLALRSTAQDEWVKTVSASSGGSASISFARSESAATGAK